jgi:hypothetical protein
MRRSLRPLAAALFVLTAAPSAFVMTGAALAQQQPDAADQEVKQVALTARQVDNYIAAKKDMDALTDKAPDTGDKPDQVFLAQLDAGAKKHGFADYGEYDDVSNNIGLAMDGVDPQTKKYVGSEVMLKKQLADVQADKQMPAKDKKEAIDQITVALKNPPKLQFPANADLVIKNFDRLMAAMAQQ